MHILVVEDEMRLVTLLRRSLAEEGHAVDFVTTGEDALVWVDTENGFDAVILDVMLPGIDGYETCRRLRTSGAQVPILILTARDAVPDRVAGLDAGADDYLVKPFAFAELAARLRALVRRAPETIDTVLSVADIRLDPARRQVWRGQAEIQLSNKEFRILEYLMRNPNRVLTRAMIADNVWDYEFPNVTNVIDVHVRWLRHKLEDPYPGKILQTVRGVGYRLIGES
ncbi:MAG TPA: response regulator transcription factor [Thermomicrobiales bacterium]|nr:response regulator transcription factor [Thermomicrobiales bacterium]